MRWKLELTKNLFQDIAKQKRKMFFVFYFTLELSNKFSWNFLLNVALKNPIHLSRNVKMYFVNMTSDQYSSVASLLCQEGQSERTFLSFAFSSRFFFFFPIFPSFPDLFPLIPDFFLLFPDFCKFFVIFYSAPPLATASDSLCLIPSWHKHIFGVPLFISHFLSFNLAARIFKSNEAIILWSVSYIHYQSKRWIALYHTSIHVLIMKSVYRTKGVSSERVICRPETFRLLSQLFVAEWNLCTFLVLLTQFEVCHHDFTLLFSSFGPFPPVSVCPISSRIKKIIGVVPRTTRL